MPVPRRREPRRKTDAELVSGQAFRGKRSSENGTKLPKRVTFDLEEKPPTKVKQESPEKVCPPPEYVALNYNERCPKVNELLCLDAPTQIIPQVEMVCFSISPAYKVSRSDYNMTWNSCWPSPRVPTTGPSVRWPSSPAATTPLST